MSSALFPVLAVLPSDAPLRNNLVKGPGDVPGLLRTLDAPWQTNVRARALFLREVEAARRAPAHPLLVPCLASGVSPSPFLVREFGPLGTLADLLEGDHLTLDHALPVATSVLDAVDALHRAGIAHGDPSLNNLLVTPAGGVRLADPASARLAFAQCVSTPGPPDFRADLKKFLLWFRTLVARFDSADPDLVRQIRSAAAERDVERACERIRVVADLFPPISLPPPAANPLTGAAAIPVPVRLELMPVRDPGAAYRIAKYLGGQRQIAVGDLRRDLTEGHVSIPTTWPEPARAYARDLKALQAEVDVLRDEEASPGGFVPAALARVPGDKRSVLPLIGVVASWQRFTAAFTRLFDDRPDDDLRDDAIEAAIASAILSAQLAVAHTLVPALLYLLLRLYVAAR